MCITFLLCCYGCLIYVTDVAGNVRDVAIKVKPGGLFFTETCVAPEYELVQLRSKLLI